MTAYKAGQILKITGERNGSVCKPVIATVRKDTRANGNTTITFNGKISTLIGSTVNRMVGSTIRTLRRYCKVEVIG